MKFALDAKVVWVWRLSALIDSRTSTGFGKYGESITVSYSRIFALHALLM